MNQALPKSPIRRSSHLILTLTTLGLSLSAVIIACIICLSRQMEIPIENPLILVVASFFLLPLFKSNSLATLQKLIAFYLIAVIVNEISLQHFQLRILSMDLGVSWSMPVLLLFMTACIANRLGSTKKKTQPQCRHISTAWVLALVLIISHMIVLGPILHKFYGYGYRHDLPVAGNLCLYLLLFLSVWKSLDRLWLRRFTALVLALFFLAAPFV